MGRFNPLLAVALAVILALAVITWFYPSQEDFRRTNPSWNGTSAFMERFHAQPVASLTELEADPLGTALVVIPYLGFAPAELASLEGFLRQGGTVLLMDDYAHGNQVLEYLGVEARFSGQPLLDPLLNYKSAWLPRIRRLDATDGGIGELVLNHATALVRVPEEAILAQSSSFSFLDMDGNEMWDPPREPRGPLVVAARLPVGQGSLVLVADPSIVINSMDVAGNYPFIQDVLGARELLVDQSHLPRAESVAIAQQVLATARRALSSPLGGLGLIVAVLAPTLWPLWRSKGGKN